MPTMSMKDRLFSGVYPTGIVYADRGREVGGDYKRLGFLSFATLQLEIAADTPPDLRKMIVADAKKIQDRRGQQYQVSSSGQTVTLGLDTRHDSAPWRTHRERRGRSFGGYLLAGAAGYGVARVVDGSIDLSKVKSSGKGKKTAGKGPGWYVLLYNYGPERGRDRKLKAFNGPFSTRSAADADAAREKATWSVEVEKLDTDPFTLGRSFGSHLLAVGAGYAIARAVDHPDKVRAGARAIAGEARKARTAVSGRATGRARRPWIGTDAVERQVAHVRNLLVDIVLNGVEGISPPVEGEAHRLVPEDKARQWIERADKVLASLDEQEAPRGRVRAWFNHKREELRDQLRAAQMVAGGRKRQKMTAEDYRKLRIHFNIRRPGD